MSQYKAYPAYKDSGVEWIGQVPEHWKIAPVKYHYDARLGKMIQPAAVSDRDIEVPYHRAQTVQWERIVESDIKEMWASPRDIEQFSVSEGDLLICEGGDVCRAAIVKQPPEKNMIFQNSIHRIRSKGEYGVGWIMRLMQHLRSSEWIDVLCNKNTIVHFTSDKLGSLECPLPPPDEQATIAAALDRETARIDALVEKKTRFIELLKEKRQALITHAVTKGLDPNVKMKDSGIEWIGQVPEHWEVKPFKYILSAPMSYGANESAESDDPNHPRYIRITDLTENGTLREDTFKTLPWDKAYSYLLSDGDILLARSGATVGKSFLYRETNGAACFAGYLIKASCNEEKALPKYIYAYLQSHSYWEYISGSNIQSTIQNVSAEKYSSMVLPVPQREEQATIAATLDRETARIDALIGKAEQSITLLKERRSAFITAAVTGQIDLRGKQ
ncbi:restriction endonuclease subunit S [Serratia nevei]|nr:restriction endonuclease subunit S [Serratia marcescens]MDF8321104.1 restriction endonuclease subunit S [Serratia nevei]MDF8321745.1 restriction endonuclease subunit S [Serratia nevei]MDF8341370.1 restriction endonuclease subunit S [Serratia nevei]MDF8341726.1 restriction endonuclease subunit S [Serratia nevei]MDF8352274.1 restriction endonuclease subunit S [Serratia nevei]